MQRSTLPTRSILADKAAIRRRYALRSKLRGVAGSERLRCCGSYVASAEGASILFSGGPGRWRARWRGLMSCGKIWTCPVCSAKLRAKRLARVSAGMQALGGRWQMLTFTMSHAPGDDLRKMLAGLMLALAKFRRVRGVRAIWKRAVTGSVRCVEVTWKAGGFHPHLHVLLRLKKLTSEERVMLRHSWTAAVVRELGDAHAPSLAHGLRFSKSLDVDRTPVHRLAGYLCKLGCEIVGEAKLGRRGSLSSWELGSVAGNRDYDSIRERAAWTEFQSATRGRRMLELDARTSHAAKGVRLPHSTDEYEFRIECDDSPEPEIRELAVSKDELRALRWYERVKPASFVLPLLAALEANDPCAAAREAVQKAVSRSRDGPAVASHDADEHGAS